MMEINALTVILLFVSLTFLIMLMQSNKRVQQLEQILAQQISIQFADDPAFHEQLQILLHAGEEVKAVKQVRQTLGLSLLDAKKYVDQLNTNKKSER